MEESTPGPRVSPAEVASATASALFIGIGPTINNEDRTTNLTTKVDGDPGVTVFTAPRPIAGVTVPAGAPDTPLVKRTGLPAM